VAVQLRLGFSAACVPFTLRLRLEGLFVIADVTGVVASIAQNHLASSGLPTTSYGLDLKFPVSLLPEAAALDAVVDVYPDESLTTLWELITHPPAAGTPLELSLENGKNLLLAWESTSMNLHEYLPAHAAPAFLSLDYPFIAHPDAFEVLRATCNLPVLIGKAQFNHDGFIELSTAKPQLAATAPIRGLFRMTPTLFGVPGPYATDVTNAPGIVWEVPPPEQTPATLKPIAVALSQHAQQELNDFAALAHSTNARVIMWPSGHGRRFFALAAACSLSRLPITVVCEPSHVWLWQRHAQLVGFPSGVSSAATIRIMTYEQLAAGTKMDADTIIFDDLPERMIKDPQTSQAIGRITSSALRIALGESWPTTTAEQARILCAVRPEEFTTVVPVASRYVPVASEHFAEHVACYLSVREGEDRNANQFKESNVVVCQPSKELAQQMREVSRSSASFPVRVTDLLELTSCGSGVEISSKIGTAFTLAKAARTKGQTVAVITRFDRTAALLESLLAPEFLVKDFRGQPRNAQVTGKASVVVYDKEIPYVTNIDNVIIVDYPWSAAVIDDAVGSAGWTSGTKSVSVIHMENTIDDQLAVMSAKRRDSRASAAHAQPPTEKELRLMLAQH
jgi:hypothetical protein